jgi:diguanylate cyclase (GGDEF)-like protein
VKILSNVIAKYQRIKADRAMCDTLMLVVCVFATFILVIMFNLARQFYQVLDDYVPFDLDNIVLAMAISCFYLVLYSFRRANDLKVQVSQANTDVLIGIFNRRKGTELLKQEVDRANLTNLHLSLIMLDIDNFKAINDGHGHEAGDRVLKDVMSLVQQLTRRSDILIRWGGEEFIVGCPGTELRYAVALAQRIRRAIAAHDFGLEQGVTASLGVSEYQLCEELDALIRRADEHLYVSKKSGKNQVNANLAQVGIDLQQVIPSPLNAF